MATVIVERSLPTPVDIKEIAKMEEEAGWCLELHNVKFKYSFVSSDGKRMICTYDAPDAEAVRKTQETAKLPFDRVWTAHLFPSPAAEKP